MSIRAKAVIPPLIAAALATSIAGPCQDLLVAGRPVARQVLTVEPACPTPLLMAVIWRQGGGELGKLLCPACGRDILPGACHCPVALARLRGGFHERLPVARHDPAADSLICLGCLLTV